MSNTFQAKTAASAEKVRGGYYTPEPIARFLARWVAEAGEAVLEPACGDGRILRELAQIAPGSKGVELLNAEADKARAYAPVETANFFSWFRPSEHGRWDGVAGNPPYIRFGNWEDSQRQPALALLSSAGLKPSKLTNAWVPFVLASALAVRRGGRVGLVVPAELLQVGYAAQLRGFLVENFSEITLVTFNRLVFDGILQEVVLLLGVKGRGPARIRTVQLHDAASLAIAELEVCGAPALRHEHEKWTKYFLEPEQITALRKLRLSTDLRPLGRYASVDVGIVTGRNSFFTFDDDQVRALGLQRYVAPLVSRSAQLSGLVYDEESRQQDLHGAHRTWILDAPTRLTGHSKLRAYVRSGEDAGVHLGYKCSIRSPWWTTPSMWVPDAFLLRQIHRFPRMTANATRATSTDTVHRVRVLDGVDAVQLGVALHNSATFAFTETMGRSYGGGVLELEPGEAELLPIPDPAFVTPDLASDVDLLLKSGEPEKALDIVDQRLLVDALGWEPALVETCRAAWNTLRDRRSKRTG